MSAVENPVPHKSIRNDQQYRRPLPACTWKNTGNAAPAGLAGSDDRPAQAHRKPDTFSANAARPDLSWLKRPARTAGSRRGVASRRYRPGCCAAEPSACAAPAKTKSHCGTGLSTAEGADIGPDQHLWTGCVPFLTRRPQTGWPGALVYRASPW